MLDTSVTSLNNLHLSQPVFSNHHILFSAFRPGWGFCSYALPASLVIDQLSAVGTSEPALLAAFEANSQTIINAIGRVSMPEPGKRMTLSTL